VLRLQTQFAFTPASAGAAYGPPQAYAAAQQNNSVSMNVDSSSTAQMSWNPVNSPPDIQGIWGEVRTANPVPAPRPTPLHVHAHEAQQPRRSNRETSSQGEYAAAAGDAPKHFRWTKDRIKLIVDEYERLLKENQVVTKQDENNIATKLGPQLLSLPGAHAGRAPSASACHSAWSRWKRKQAEESDHARAQLQAQSGGFHATGPSMWPYGFPSTAPARAQRDSHSHLQPPPAVPSRGRGSSNGSASDSSEGGVDEQPRMQSRYAQPPIPNEARILHEIQMNRHAIEANGAAIHSCLEILQSISGTAHHGVHASMPRGRSPIAGSRGRSPSGESRFDRRLPLNPRARYQPSLPNAAARRDQQFHRDQQPVDADDEQNAQPDSIEYDDYDENDDRGNGMHS
jgi:hypothetical protein